MESVLESLFGVWILTFLLTNLTNCRDNRGLKGLLSAKKISQKFVLGMFEVNSMEKEKMTLNDLDFVIASYGYFRILPLK